MRRRAILGYGAAGVAKRIPDGVRGSPDQPRTFGGMHGKGKQGCSAADGLAVFNRFDPHPNGMGDTVPKPHCGKIGIG